MYKSERIPQKTKQQVRMKMEDDFNAEQKHIIGNVAEVHFRMFNASIDGKVDTGATTSSLHASNVQVNKDRGTVSFVCEELSPNTITLDLHGAIEVHSADNGGDVRPTIMLDIEIEGVELRDTLFNLNDRSNMDSPLLIGQNILKQGNFHIDVNKDEEQPVREEVETDAPRSISEHEDVVKAIEILREKNVTFEEIFRYLTTEAQHKIDNLES